MMPENLINLIMYAIACQANRWNTYAYACCINNVATSGQPDKMPGFAAIEENIQLTFLFEWRRGRDLRIGKL